jgi:hypothetical protein
MDELDFSWCVTMELGYHSADSCSCSTQLLNPYILESLRKQEI